jgi:hypothetical protein
MSRSTNSENYETTGDRSGWHDLTPSVWQAIANQSCRIPESIANKTYDRSNSKFGLLEQQCFSSALQVIKYAFGWQHIGIGLDHWRRTGYAEHDPCLTTVKNLLGHNIEQLRDFAWKRLNPSSSISSNLEVTDYSILSNDGGTDCLHLLSHLDGPSESNPVPLITITEYSNQGLPDRALLELLTYPGWHKALLTTSDQGPLAKCKIDVYCKTVGWLGKYSKSPESGKFHRTSAEIHAWGLLVKST